jgi:hypothetical protein
MGVRDTKAVFPIMSIVDPADRRKTNLHFQGNMLLTVAKMIEQFSDNDVCTLLLRGHSGVSSFGPALLHRRSKATPQN